MSKKFTITCKACNSDKVSMRMFLRSYMDGTSTRDVEVHIQTLILKCRGCGTIEEFEQ